MSPRNLSVARPTGGTRSTPFTGAADCYTPRACRRFASRATPFVPSHFHTTSPGRRQHAAGGASEGVHAMGKALEFTDDNFQQEVLDSPVPVLVDFWAPWCGPCRMIGPTIEELSTENAGTFRVGKVNVDENQRLAMAYNDASIPTILIFKGGRMVQQFMGVQAKAKLQQALDEAKSA
ncbi:MAG: thioredoxin [Planctomycetia bacterium]